MPSLSWIVVIVIVVPRVPGVACREELVTEQVEIVELVVVAHDGSFYLAAVNPRHIILKGASHQKCRVRDHVRSYSNVAFGLGRHTKNGLEPGGLD